ncbi:hypothetical protein [Streptomyces sp. NRRL F-2799]|uniref:hypothetical protein n=1 Tax=Streptomyces sp. NRRL F-2799 TaxID=1463844 RepID=UPI0004CB645C|nr:hypothetical protein [Streptomyces sp. NRRL F-2799]
MEDFSTLLEGDPVAGPFLRPELRRVAPLLATERYTARFRGAAASRPADYVAYHYTLLPAAA